MTVVEMARRLYAAELERTPLLKGVGMIPWERLPADSRAEYERWAELAIKGDADQ